MSALLLPPPPPAQPPSGLQHQESAILSPSQHPKSHLCLPFLGGAWEGHDTARPPKPRAFCLCGGPPLPATWPSQRLVGSEAGGGLGSANGSPLPAILSPCLSHLCPPPPSPSMTTPLPGQAENDIDRRPPPRGGGGARGRLLRKGSEAVSPPPPSLPHPAARASPTPPLCARMAAGAAEKWDRTT